jgi:PAT family beta-lactamase induction signal transducer AmpG
MFKFLLIYCQANITKVCLYGFISGLSLLLSGNTINFWLASVGINTKIIGFFSCIALPYALKYLIAIFIEHRSLIYLSKKVGHHKSWLVLSQLIISLILVFMSNLIPENNLALIAASGFFISLFSVITDVILNANRIKILDSYQQPVGTAMYNLGYRLGMLLSGAGVIYASVSLSWQVIYSLLASLYIALALILSLIYKEPKHKEPESIINNRSIWYNIFIKPFEHFMSINNFIWIAIFILLYRLSDNMLAIMLNPFLIHLKFSAEEIATISKFFGTLMVIVGSLISAPLINKLKIRNSLISFSLFHILGHCLFIFLNFTGKNIQLLYFITGYEALTGGMVMTAYIYFISGLCKGKHVATQYALLSSGIGLSRVIFPMSSGLIVSDYGWFMFFLSIILLSMIAIIFTILMPKQLYK